MTMVKIYPANKEYFIRLKEFGNHILGILKETDVAPVVWGSLAYFLHTKDKKIIIHDIDFLVPEKSFEKIIKNLRNKNVNYRYTKKWHVIELFNGDLKIDIDSIDYWYKGSKDFKNFEIDGLDVKVVSLNNLIEVYKKASKVSKDKPEDYRKKLIEMKKFV